MNMIQEQRVDVIDIQQVEGREATSVLKDTVEAYSKSDLVPNESRIKEKSPVQEEQLCSPKPVFCRGKDQGTD